MSYDVPTIREIVHSIQLDNNLNVKDENIIRTIMYKHILNPGDVTLENYLSKQETDDAMLGTSRGYSLFVHKKIMKDLKDYKHIKL